MSDSHNSGGIGFVGLLTILFIALKLTHFIDWPWMVVLLPIWIPIGILMVVLAIVLIVYLNK